MKGTHIHNKCAQTHNAKKFVSIQKLSKSSISPLPIPLVLFLTISVCKNYNLTFNIKRGCREEENEALYNVLAKELCFLRGRMSSIIFQSSFSSCQLVWDEGEKRKQNQ